MDEITPLGPATPKTEPKSLVERTVDAITGNKMRYCAQRGCSFEAKSDPELCLVCGHPFIPHPDPSKL